MQDAVLPLHARLSTYRHGPRRLRVPVCRQLECSHRQKPQRRPAGSRQLARLPVLRGSGRARTWHQKPPAALGPNKRVGDGRRSSGVRVGPAFRGEGQLDRPAVLACCAVVAPGPRCRLRRAVSVGPKARRNPAQIGDLTDENRSDHTDRCRAGRRAGGLPGTHPGTRSNRTRAGSAPARGIIANRHGDARGTGSPRPLFPRLVAPGRWGYR